MKLFDDWTTTYELSADWTIMEDSSSDWTATDDVSADVDGHNWLMFHFGLPILHEETVLIVADTYSGKVRSSSSAKMNYKQN